MQLYIIQCLNMINQTLVKSEMETNDHAISMRKPFKIEMEI